MVNLSAILKKLFRGSNKIPAPEDFHPIPPPVDYGKPPSGMRFQNLLWDDVKKFFDACNSHSDGGIITDDGSLDYKVRVIVATAEDELTPAKVRGLGELKIKEYYGAALEVNPIFGITQTNFGLQPLPIDALGLPNKGKAGVYTAAAVPTFSKAEGERLMYQAIVDVDYGEPLDWSEWRAQLAERSLTVNYDMMYMPPVIKQDYLYEALIERNPHMSEKSARNLLKRIEEDRSLEIRLNQRDDGTYALPVHIANLRYKPREKDSQARVLGRPDLDVMVERDLKVLEEYRNQWQEARKRGDTGFEPELTLQNRLLLGDFGTGKTTLMRNFAYRAVTELGIEVFDLGKVSEGESGTSLANEIRAALDSIHAYSEVTGRPTLIIWDDMTELIKVNDKGTLDRDELISTLKRSIGGMDDGPGVLIYASGNPAHINKGFFTPKRWGKPIMFRSTIDTQVQMIFDRANTFGFTDMPSTDIVRDFLRSMPAKTTNENIDMIIGQARDEAEMADESRKPTYQDFVRHSTLMQVGDPLTMDLTPIEIRDRARYVAGAVTLALALGSVPFAAKVHPTNTQDMPEIYFSVSEDKPRHSLVEFLALCAGFDAVDNRRGYDIDKDGRITILDTPMHSYAGTVMGMEAGYLIDDVGLSAYGVDAMIALRQAKKMPLPVEVYEDTTQLGVVFAHQVLDHNFELYSEILQMLEGQDVLYRSDLEGLSAKIEMCAEPPAQFYAQSGSRIYQTGKRPDFRAGTLGFSGIASPEGGLNFTFFPPEEAIAHMSYAVAASTAFVTSD